ncbi:unnamed protein product [Musa acuminata var. zebrina]
MVGCDVPSCISNWSTAKNRPELFISSKCFFSCSLSIGWQPNCSHWFCDIWRARHSSALFSSFVEWSVPDL